MYQAEAEHFAWKIILRNILTVATTAWSGNLSEVVYLLKYGTVQTQPGPRTQALYHLTTGPSTLLLSLNGEKGGKHT